MTPTEMRNERLAQRLMKNLARRHYESYYCKTAADIVGKVRELIPEGSSVTWGGSMSIRDTGVTRMLKEGNYQVFDRDEVTTAEDKVRMYRKAFECDYYLASVNAMSEDGIMVNIDGNGNRVAASVSGPKRVVYAIGRNKIVEGGIDDAIARIKAKACPPNCVRLGKRTPCAATGKCADCDSPDRICKVTAIFDRRPTGTPTAVYVVDSDLGY